MTMSLKNAYMDFIHIVNTLIHHVEVKETSTPNFSVFKYYGSEREGEGKGS